MRLKLLLIHVYLYIYILFKNNIMFIIRAGFIRYSVVSALEVIPCNWCLVMNKELKTNARSNYICKYEVSPELYPEWPHRQCVGLVFRRSHDRGSLSAASLVICIAVCNTWSSGGTALCRVGGATSQLDLPSLTPLCVAGYGWLQLMAPHWALQ